MFVIRCTPVEEMVPAGQADPEDHLGDAEDDGDLHLEAVQHRDPQNGTKTSSVSSGSMPSG
jgi:hypothetical protein